MPQAQPVSRREAIRYLGLIGAGMAAGACTPLRIVTHSYPDDFKHDVELVERALRAFVVTVIPGAAPDSPNLTRAHLDRHYLFASYAAFFAADLSKRSGDRFGERAFDQLTIERRTVVIQDGLAGDATTRKLYQGAIYLAQVSFYGGIYDDDAGCPLIDFPGRYRGVEVSYGDCHRFLPTTLTANGNYA
jgi:hypothetical protein